MEKYYLEIINCQPRITEFYFKENINWRLKYDEVWAIVGNNGAGKTVLSGIISGKYPVKSGKIKYNLLNNKDIDPWQAVKTLTFDSVYGLADFRNSYYQQRWHSTENDDMPCVSELLGEYPDPEIISIFGIEEFLEKKINFLSSGELRKFLITKTILEEPKILIIDNPYIGLDAPSREILSNALNNLVNSHKTQIIFIFPSGDNIPDFVTDILPIDKMQLFAPVSYKNYMKRKYPELEKQESKNGRLFTEENIIELNNITVKYGTKTIIENFNWQIKKGEKWALSGANGKGKSTLLSLINADHPQAYSNNIKIFGRKRGPGQSIWDIKKRIGYISPEMHTFYFQNIPVLDVVASGLYDTIGTVYTCTAEQKEKCIYWLNKFGIGNLGEKTFIKLSSGEQRLVLIARTFVKEPELLILDEPLHGLDIYNKINVRHIIDEYASGSDKTLIYVSHYINEFPSCINQRITL